MPTWLPSLPAGFGLSVVAHVGLIAVAVNVPAARLVASAEAPESRIELEVTEPLEVEASDPTAEEAARPAVRSSRALRHRHPYPIPLDHDAVPHDPRIVHQPAATAPPSEAATERGALLIGGEPDVASAAPRFTLAPVGQPAVVIRAGGARAAPDVTSAPGLPTGGVAAHVAGAGGGGASAEEVFAESRVTARARLVASVPPLYPAAARRNEIEADVPLEIVVDAAGRVRSAAALDGVGVGLGEAARAAVARYRFSPALRDGRPVAVRMRWIVQFRLR